MSGFECTTEPVTRTQIVRFAGAAGDFNPMHHDEPFARAAGQPGVFAMGQLQAAILSSAVANWLGGPQNVLGYGVSFRDKVWPGDRLVLRGQLVEAPRGLRRLELAAAREEDGTVVMTGWALARAGRDPSGRRTYPFGAC
jgi:acyl dehydratase